MLSTFNTAEQIIPLTRAVRHIVLKWARCFLGGRGESTSSLMLIGWHAANMSSMSSGQEQPWRSKSVEQITLDLFQNCDVPEEVSGTFEVRFKWGCCWWISPRAVLFCSQPDNATENLSLWRGSREPCSRAGRGAFEGACIAGVPVRGTFKSKSSKIRDYIRTWCTCK